MSYPLLLIPCHVLTLHMDYFYGFADGSNCYTLDLASAAWVLYSQAHDLVSSGQVCLGPAINNIVVCYTMIELLIEASSHGINHMMST